jgi:hypothetical protein
MAPARKAGGTTTRSTSRWPASHNACIDDALAVFRPEALTGPTFRSDELIEDAHGHERRAAALARKTSCLRGPCQTQEKSCGRMSRAA